MPRNVLNSPARVSDNAFFRSRRRLPEHPDTYVPEPRHDWERLSNELAMRRAALDEGPAGSVGVPGSVPNALDVSAREQSAFRRAALQDALDMGAMATAPLTGGWGLAASGALDLGSAANFARELGREHPWLAAGVPIAAAVPFLSVNMLRQVDPSTMSTLSRAYPGQRGAVRGMKRFRPMYHGTSADDLDAIMSDGFLYGSSSELGTPGTSLSADPTVSINRFAERSDPYNVLRVYPTTDPKDVYNLRHSEFYTGKVPDAEVVNKPNAGGYHEFETFIRRFGDEAPDLDVRRLSLAEQRRLGLESEGAVHSWDRVNHLEPNILNEATDMPDIAYAVNSTRGNRGAFEGVMYQLVKKFTEMDEYMRQSVEDAARYIGGDRAQVRKMIEDARATAGPQIESVFSVARPYPAIRASRDYKKILLAVDRERMEPVHNISRLTGEGGETLSVGEARQMLDDAARTWVRERNALADRIESAYLSMVPSIRGKASRIRHARGQRRSRINVVPSDGDYELPAQQADWYDENGIPLPGGN